jgi:hypothetical protein
MAVIEILGIVFGIVAAIAVAVFYGFLYFYTQSTVIPQFQSVMGSVLVGSIILSVLSYLSLIQEEGGTRLRITCLIVFFPIIIACVAIGVAS